MIPIEQTHPSSTACASWCERSSILAFAFLASVVLALTLEAGIAHAATFNVTNTKDSGPGSLRQAITDANANNNPGTRDVVAFDIPAATDPGCDAGGVCTISPTGRLPAITQAVSIDGYTQQGASANTLSTGNNAELKIELSGERDAGNDGIRIIGPNSVIKGLIINRWIRQAGVDVDSVDATGNRIEGNFIGTDASGRERLFNFSGVLIIYGASNNVVGGASPAARNVISGNGDGVTVAASEGSGGNRIEGNLIGTDASGTEDLGNRYTGVEIFDARNTVVGGTTATSSNTIAFNGFDGVDVVSSGTGNRILRNSIFDNGGLGIDLDRYSGEDPSVVTPNDPRDPDFGPNRLQNYPTITSAITTGEQTTIRGTLNSNPRADFALRFFDSPTADPSGFGEGKTYLGQSIVSTNASGNATFALTIDAPLRVGHVVSATATNRVSKDTSEFSRAVEVEDGIPPTVVSTNPRDGATGVLAAVNVSATFSEQMKASTINTTTFKLFRKVGTTDQRVAAVVSYDVAQKRATLNPNANLVPGGRYEAQVTTGVQDLAGNGLAQRKDFTFTVRR